MKMMDSDIMITMLIMIMKMLMASPLLLLIILPKLSLKITMMIATIMIINLSYT